MRSIITKYHPASAIRGAYVTAEETCGNKLRVPIHNQLSDLDNHRKSALLMCKKMNWKDVILVQGSHKEGTQVFVLLDPDQVFEVNEDFEFQKFDLSKH